MYGFLEHLDSRAAAELLLQSITTEARQQMIFRQLEGLFPMPVSIDLDSPTLPGSPMTLQIWFLPAITQSMTWTLLSPFIVTCPAGNPHIQWQNFPALNITVSVGIVNAKAPPYNSVYRITRQLLLSLTPQLLATALCQLSLKTDPSLCPLQVNRCC